MRVTDAGVQLDLVHGPEGCVSKEIVGSGPGEIGRGFLMFGLEVARDCQRLRTSQAYPRRARKAAQKSRAKPWIAQYEQGRRVARRSARDGAVETTGQLGEENALIE